MPNLFLFLQVVKVGIVEQSLSTSGKEGDLSFKGVIVFSQVNVFYVSLLIVCMYMYSQMSKKYTFLQCIFLVWNFVYEAFLPNNLQWTQMMRWEATQASCPPQHPHRLVRMGRRSGAPLHSLPPCPPPFLELGTTTHANRIIKNKTISYFFFLTVRCVFIVKMFVSDFALFSCAALHVRAVKWWDSRWTTGRGKAQRRRKRVRRETWDWRTPWRAISVHCKSAGCRVEGNSPLHPVWPWLWSPRRRTRKVKKKIWLMHTQKTWVVVTLYNREWLKVHLSDWACNFFDIVDD